MHLGTIVLYEITRRNRGIGECHELVDVHAAALVIAVIGIAVQHLNLGVDIMNAQGPTVIKAGAPVVVTDRSGSIIR